MNSSKRISYIDIARGIAIICIVLGHLSINEINRVVFTFHVPIFYLISGFFMNDKMPYLQFVKRKARTLLVPYFVTCLVMIFVAVLDTALFTDWEGSLRLTTLLADTKVSLFSYVGRSIAKTALEWIYAAVYGAGDSYTSPFYIKMIGAIWFLWASFWGNIFLRKLLEYKKEIRILGVAVLFFLGYWSRSLFWFPLSIQAGCCAVVFMYLGYLAQNAKGVWQEVSAETKSVIRILAFLVWIFFIRDFTSFWLVHCDIGRGIIDIVGCLCACYMIFLISKWLDGHAGILAKGLGFLGRYSLIMLCVHNIELNLYPWGITMEWMRESGFPLWLQRGTLIGGKLLLLILVTFLCSRNSVIRKIFLPGVKDGSGAKRKKIPKRGTL